MNLQMTDLSVAGSAADFIKYFVDRLDEVGIAVVTQVCGLACHVDAKRFSQTCPRLFIPLGRSFSESRDGAALCGAAPSLDSIACAFRYPGGQD